MTSEELREIIKQPEGAKLDFKRDIYKLNRQPPEGKDKDEWNKIINYQRDELIRDILALTNGDVGTFDKSAFLIIGVTDKEREIRNVPHSEELTAQNISTLVNRACDPSVNGIQCDPIQLDSKNIYVITIPPSLYVHETTRELETKESKKYSKCLVFYRKGEDVEIASSDKRRELEEEKRIYRHRELKKEKRKFDCGIKLREVREDLGLMVSEFVELIKFPSQKAYVQAEKGKVEIPLSVLERVASLTGVSIEWLKHGRKTTVFSRLFQIRTKFNIESFRLSHVDEIIKEINDFDPETLYFAVHAPAPGPHENTLLCLVIKQKYCWKIFNWGDSGLYRKKYIFKTFYLIEKLNHLFDDKKYIIYGLFLSKFEMNQLTSGVVHPSKIVEKAKTRNIEGKASMQDWPIDILDVNHKNSSKDTYEEWYGKWFIESQRYFRELQNDEQQNI